MTPLDAFGDPLANVLGISLAAYVAQAFARAAYATWRERQLDGPGRDWHRRMAALASVTRGRAS